MRPRTQSRVVSALGRISLLCLTLFLCPFSLEASVNSSNRIICREELSLTRREELADKLRAITGWARVWFTSGGALQVDPVVRSNGSQTARDLLGKALGGGNVIILEDAGNRHEVVFGHVARARLNNHGSEIPATFVIQIDFADFDHLMGDRPALKAFDVGWAFLHEIGHVVNDFEDATAAGDAGECEDHINLMRSECNLPLRTDYFFTYFPFARESDFKTRFVRLAFDHKDPATTKRRRYWVMWDATLVGGLDKPQVMAKRR